MMGMRLREAVRDTDVVARQGGDEFLVLLADLERGSMTPRPEAENSVVVAQAVAGRIHEALATPFIVGGTEFFISASIGISLSPFDGDTGRNLLKNADVAMYRAKRRGPGGCAITNRSSTCRMRIWWAWRPCCAGRPRAEPSSRPVSSSHWPKRWG